MDTLLGIVIGVIACAGFWFLKPKKPGARKDPAAAGREAKDGIMAMTPKEVVASLDDETRSALERVTRGATKRIMERIRERRGP